MNKSDLSRNSYMLTGALAKKGYDWWWHSFVGFSRKTGRKRAFFVEYFVINPALGEDRPVLGQTPEKRLPSYVMIKAGAWGDEAKQLHDTVFDIGGGWPVVFGRALERRLLMDIFYESKDYEFNFSKFWTGCKTTFDCHETETEIIWDIHTQNRKAAMDVFCLCPKSEMLLVNYEAPDGRKRHNRLWNGGTGRGTIKLYKKHKGQRILMDDMSFCDAGCEYGEYTE